MKVVFLNSSMGKGVTTRLLVELSREFQNKGVDASVWGLYKSDEKYISEPGCLYIVDHYPNAFEHFKILVKLVKALRVYQPDVLFCSLPFANILGALGAKVAGIKKVIAIHHGMFPKYSEMFFRIRVEILLGMLGFFDQRICVSNSVKKAYSYKIDPFKRSLKVVFNATSIKNSSLQKDEARKKFNLPIQPFTLVTLGRLSPEKNHRFLIDVVAKIPNCHLAICGDGKLKKDLVDRSKYHGIEDRIHFIGHIDLLEVSHFLKAGDLFVFPSHHEGFGLAAVEAMQSGLPVIASDISTLQEVVNSSGVLLPLELSLWVRQIKNFMNDKMLLKKFSEKSIERARAFSIKNMSDQYFNIAAEI